MCCVNLYVHTESKVTPKLSKKEKKSNEQPSAAVFLWLCFNIHPESSFHYAHFFIFVFANYIRHHTHTLTLFTNSEKK